MKLLVATEMIGGRFHRIRSSAAEKCTVRPKLRDIFTRPGPKADLLKASPDVRFWGSADIASASRSSRITSDDDNRGARAPAFLSDANALLNIGRRSPRADIARAGWKCL
jgi:hypothetical protein